MERPNKRLKDQETNEVLEFVFRNGMGNPIILQSIPDSSQMKANTWGIYSSDLYIKFANNVLLKFSGTIIS